MTNSSFFFFARPILPAGSGVTSKRRRRLYSASLPNLLRSDDCERDFFMTVLALGTSHLVQVEHSHYGRMVAGSNLTVDRALRRFRSQRFTRHNVIEPPTDIALAQVAPGRPPGEKILVIGVQRAPHIYESLSQNALEDLSLLPPLPHERRSAFLRVNVTLCTSNIDVSTEDESPAARMNFRNIALHLAQELYFGRKIFAAVGNVDGNEAQIAHLCGHDAGLIVEGRVQEARFLQKGVPSDVEAD